MRKADYSKQIHLLVSRDKPNIRKLEQPRLNDLLQTIYKANIRTDLISLSSREILTMGNVLIGHYQNGLELKRCVSLGRD